MNFDNSQTKSSLGGEKSAQQSEKNVHSDKKCVHKEQFCEKKEEYEKKINELTETLQRLQAEFENYQKRSNKYNEEFKQFANASLIEQLLPVLDTLEQGVNHTKEFALIYEQIFSLMKKNGVEKIVVEEGNTFDHDIMECLTKQYDELVPIDKVLKVLITGYKLNGKILRLAKVIVSNGKTPIDHEKKEENKKTDEVREPITRVDYTIQKMESD